jgi:hypothetical protein
MSEDLERRLAQAVREVEELKAKVRVINTHTHTHTPRTCTRTETPASETLTRMLARGCAHKWAGGGGKGDQGRRGG